MKDYNFISDDGLERFRILRGVWRKRGGDFFKGGSYPGTHYGLGRDAVKMTFALSDKKLKHVSQQCQEIFTQPKTSVLNLTKLIGLLSSTVQVFLPARIQFRHLLQEQKKGSNLLQLYRKRGPIVVM